MPKDAYPKIRTFHFPHNVMNMEDIVQHVI